MLALKLLNHVDCGLFIFRIQILRKAVSRNFDVCKGKLLVAVFLLLAYIRPFLQLDNT